MTVAQQSSLTIPAHSLRAAVPRELELALSGPVGPQRWRDDTIIIDRDGWYRTLTPSSSWPAANEVLFSNLNTRATEAALEAELDALIAEYHERGLALTWCVYPWTQPANLGQRLLARGATKSDIHAFLSSTTLPLKGVAGVDIERITPAATEAYEAYIGTMAAGFALPADEEAFRRQRYAQLSAGANPCLHLFLARCEGVVAGCCAVLMKEDSAHMTGVHVVPMFQARGVFLSLKAAAMSFLRAQGIALVTGHANKLSAVWAERFGARLIYPYSIFQLNPPAVVE